MASNPESHADIVKEMREFGDHCAAFGGAYSPERWNKLCNRLEAAHKREVDELKAVLKSTVTAMCNYCCSTPEAKELPCVNGCETMRVAKYVLEETK